MVGEAPSPAQLASATERTLVDETLAAAEFTPFARDRLLPLLLELKRRLGTLSKGALGYLGERIRVPFAELYGVASFYALLSPDAPAVRVRLCSGVPCILAGAEALADALRRTGQTNWEWFPCIGQCDRAPAALVGEEAYFQLSPAATLGLVHGDH